jgi:hypothetical protein
MEGLIDTRDEYMEHIQDLLSIPISKRLYGIYNDCFSNKRTLKDFQNELLEIRKWNNNIVADEYKKVVKYTKCTYMHNLIKVIIISTIKIKIYEYKDQFDNIKIKVPNPEDFVHRCYINCAMFSWKNAYLFNRINIKNAEYQNNLNIIEENIRRIIKKTFRDFIPFEEIFLQIEKNLTDNVSQFNEKSSTKSPVASENNSDDYEEESEDDDEESEEDDEEESGDDDEEESEDDDEEEVALNECLEVPEINNNDNIELNDGYHNEKQDQVYTHTNQEDNNQEISSPDKETAYDMQAKVNDICKSQTDEKEDTFLASHDYQEDAKIEDKYYYNLPTSAQDYIHQKELLEQDDDAKSVASVASRASVATVATAISNISDVKEIFINDLPKSSKKPSFF